MLTIKQMLSATFAVAALATQAFAGSSNYQGTFTLPFEARLGKTVLQPGSYTISTLEEKKGIRIKGEKGDVAVLAAGYDLKPNARNAKLTLVETDNGYAIESFESASMGRTMHFGVSKSKHGHSDHGNKQTLEVGMQ